MMETEAKDRMWQCRYCSGHYPGGFLPILVLHLQWHIEQDPDQRPGQHQCPWSTGRKGPCRAEFSTPEGLAIHTLENHTRKRWCSVQKEKYRKASKFKLGVISITSVIKELSVITYFQMKYIKCQ